MPEVGYIFPNDAAKQVIEVSKAIKLADDQLLKYSQDADKLIKILREENISFEKLTNAKTKTRKATKDIDAVQRKLIQSEQRLKELTDVRTKSIIANRVEAQKQTKEMKQNIIIAKSQKGAYDQITNSLNKNIAKWKSLSAAERNNSKAGKQLLSTIQRQDRELKKLDAQIGRSQRHVGNYGRALGGVARNLLGAFGVIGGIAAFAQILRGAFNTLRNFTKESSVLAGVLGSTRDQIEQLTDQAISLGAIYPVTASEVSKLQVSFARLGFTQSEIIDLTEATIQGSIALNAELDRTATLVGAVVRAYNSLRTSDSQDIIDQLTISTQRTSLSFDSLETALPKVAAAANAMNVPLSKTLSLLGIAHDATLDASIAGTSLRNIFLELSKEGISLEDALVKINSSQNKLTTAYEMFGKRAAVVALSLANNIDKVSQLDEEINKAGGTAERVAEEQMNNLDGALKSVGSSWEKLVLAFRESEGPLRSFFKELSDLFDNWSSEYLTGWEKFIATFSGRASRRLADENRKLADILRQVSEASHETELAEIRRQNEVLLRENERFAQNFAEAEERRYQTLADQRETERTRMVAAEQQAQVERIAAINERNDELSKETGKIYNNITSKKQEADENYQESFDELMEWQSERQQEALNNEIENTEESLKKELELRKILTEAAVNERQRQYQREVLLIQASSKTAKEERQKIFELNQRFIEEDIQSLQSQLEQENLSAERKIEIEEKIKDLQLENQQIVADDQKEKDQERLERQQQVISTIQELTGNLFDYSIERTRQELEILRSKNEQGLLSEKQFAEEKSKLEEKLAKQQRNKALFEVAINTASAIVQALPNIPLSIAVGAIGAIQAATIASKKIPEYAEGTKSAESEFIAGEAGTELLKLRSNKLILADKPTHFKGSQYKGATVYNNRETEMIMNRAEKENKIFFDTEGLRSDLRGVKKAIEKKPVQIVDRSGKIIGYKTEKYRETYLNRLKYGG